MNPIFTAVLAHAASRSVLPPSALWSNAATWGGLLPQANDAVTIPYGTSITLDTTTNSLLSLRVEGDLIISSSVDSWLQLNRGSIGPTGRVISGGWTYTSGGIPIRGAANTRTHRRTHYGATKAGAVRGFTHIVDTPTGNNATTNDDYGINRGWLVESGGQYLMNHDTPAVLATRVQGHLAAGTQTLILSQPVTWKAGDELLLPPTGFYDAAKRTERRIVAADVNNSTTVTITTPLGYARWGVLQYPTDAGVISLTAGAFTTGASGLRATTLVPSVIDQRCKVFNLTRKLIIEGANDSELTTNRLGAHEMYMGASTRVSVVGARYQNCGQAGLNGRYPIHFHMNAYNADGTMKTNSLTGLADGTFAPGQAVIERCAVVDSQNRLHSAHGCKGVLFKDLIGDNIKGHAYLSEDGSEVGNTWDGCFVTRVVVPAVGEQIKAHDSNPSGWWNFNLDNRWIATGALKNGGADCEFSGAINISSQDRAGKPGGCWGASGLVPLSPAYTAPTQWDGFECHSNGQYGRIAFNEIIDEQGNVGNPNRRAATTTKKAATFDQYLPSIFRNDFLWKNSFGGYGNNVSRPIYDGWAVVDNRGPDFSGNVDSGEIQNCLWVSHSLNNADSNAADLREGMTSYHGQLIGTDSSVFGYASTGTPTLINDVSSRFDKMLKMQAWQGAVDTYLFPFIGYFHESVNLRFAGTGPSVYISPGPSLQNVAPWSTFAGGVMPASRQGVLAHSYYDEWGTLFRKGAGKYGILDHPSVTFGAANLSPILSSDGLAIGNTSTTTPMIGFQHRGIMNAEDGTSTLGLPIAYQRVDPTTLADQPGALITFITSSDPGLGGKDFMASVPVGGWGRMFNPVTTTRRWSATNWTVEAAVQGLSAWFGIGIPVANTRAFTFAGYATATAVADKASLLAATTTSWWRDTTTEIVWIKYVMTNVLDQRNSTYNAISTRTHGYGKYYSEFAHS